MSNDAEQFSDNLDRPFTITGRRAYLIGQQHGGFPDLGAHLPGEMGGLWSPPLKLADGFWFGVTPESSQETGWLCGENCLSYTQKPGGAVRNFSILNGTLSASQELWIPETEPGLVISLTLTNNGQSRQELLLSWLVRFDLQGAWWSHWPDRPDEAAYYPDSGAISAWDSLSTHWGAAMQGSEKPAGYITGPEIWGPEITTTLQGDNPRVTDDMIPNRAELQGQGITGCLEYLLSLAPGECRIMHFAIAGGQEGPEKARQHAANLLANRETLLAEKLVIAEEVLEGRPTLNSPRPDFNRAFATSALCLDMLTLELPGVGRGVVAGLPEFGWFFGCDTYYTVGGLLVSGQSQTALSTMLILAAYANLQAGRTPHEITQTGRLFNPGNTIETAYFVTTVEQVFRWTGDQKFLAEIYPLCCQGIFEYVLGTCDPDRTLLPDGAGLLELRGAEHGKKLDVAASLHQGLQSLAYLAGVVGDEETARRSLWLAEEVAARIDRHFWNETNQEYLWRIEPDLTAVAGEPAHSYAMLEMGVLQEPERVAALFARVESPEHTGPEGIIHPGTADFVMPIQNGIVALAEFKYNRPDQGLWYLERMVELCGHYMPWAIPEFVGRNACFIQAWSSAMFNWLAIQGFFRLTPDPHTGVVQVRPQLPATWDYLEVSNLPLCGGRYNLTLKREGDAIRFSAETLEAGHPALRFEVNPTKI